MDLPTTLALSLCAACLLLAVSYAIYMVFIWPFINPITNLPGPRATKLFEFGHMNIVMEYASAQLPIRTPF